MSSKTSKALVHDAAFVAAKFFPGVIDPTFGRAFIAPFYHSVSERQLPHVQALYTARKPREFERDIDSLLGRFKPVALYDLIGAVRGGGTLPKQSFFLSFDDGLRDVFDIVAPILRRKGVPATFFITTGCIDNRILLHRHKLSLIAGKIGTVSSSLLRHVLPDSKLNRGYILSLQPSDSRLIDEIAAACELDFSEYLKQARPYLTTNEIRWLCDNSFTIGGHTVSHPHPEHVGSATLGEEGIESVRFLRQQFGLNYGAFAFPFTDTGVPREVFDLLHSSALIDITFGSSGFRTDPIRSNIQRIAMEHPGLSAEQVLAGNSILQWLRSLSGRGSVLRV